MIVNNAPCICGHIYEQHFLDEDGQMIDEGIGYCLDCHVAGQECPEYRLDGLKYLELKYEVKHGSESRT